MKRVMKIYMISVSENVELKNDRRPNIVKRQKNHPLEKDTLLKNEHHPPKEKNHLKENQLEERRIQNNQEKIDFTPLERRFL